MTSTVNIAKVVYGGDGLGRLGDGRVVFVPGALPGEQVKAEIVEEKPRYVRARLVEIVEASPDRTGAEPPPIPGMAYANFTRKAEIETKAAQLADFFERARIPLPSPPVCEAAEGAFNYRNKVVYHFGMENGEWVLGYRKEPGHSVVDVESDPLARREINLALPAIRRHVMSLLTQGAPNVRKTIERKGNLTIRWSLASGVKWWVGDRPPPNAVMKECACGRTFEVPADGFWQVNPEVAQRLYRSVADEFERGRAAAPDILDLYCGVGVFGLCCRPRSLFGVESGKQAVAFAERNAAAQAMGDARFVMGQVGQLLKKIPFSETATVVLDPPRSGLEHHVARAIAKSRAPRVLYVSCDPATLVRDLRSLAQAFEIRSVRWFDMFPRTARFETFVTLERKK